jgi:hypothetical protein
METKGYAISGTSVRYCSRHGSLAVNNNHCWKLANYVERLRKTYRTAAIRDDGEGEEATSTLLQNYWMHLISNIILHFIRRICAHI